MMLLLAATAWDAVGVIGAAALAAAASMYATRHTAKNTAERTVAPVATTAASAAKEAIEAKTLAVHTSDRVDKVAREEGAFEVLRDAVDDIARRFMTMSTTDAKMKADLIAEIAVARQAVEECERDRAADHEERERERATDRERIAVLERDVAQNAAALAKLAPGLIQRPTDGG